jgi:uncharacterized protein (DUF2062 family)
MTTLVPLWLPLLFGAIIGSVVTLACVAAFMMYVANRTGAKVGR